MPLNSITSLWYKIAQGIWNIDSERTLKFKKKFDVVTLFHVLEHLTDQVEILKTVKKNSIGIDFDEGSRVFKHTSLSCNDKSLNGKTITTGLVKEYKAKTGAGLGSVLIDSQPLLVALLDTPIFNQFL